MLITNATSAHSIPSEAVPMSRIKAPLRRNGSFAVFVGLIPILAN